MHFESDHKLFKPTELIKFASNIKLHDLKQKTLKLCMNDWKFIDQTALSEPSHVVLQRQHFHSSSWWLKAAVMTLIVQGNLLEFHWFSNGKLKFIIHETNFHSNVVSRKHILREMKHCFVCSYRTWNEFLIEIHTTSWRNIFRTFRRMFNSFLVFLVFVAVSIFHFHSHQLELAFLSLVTEFFMQEIWHEASYAVKVKRFPLKGSENLVSVSIVASTSFNGWHETNLFPEGSCSHRLYLWILNEAHC